MCVCFDIKSKKKHRWCLTFAHSTSNAFLFYCLIICIVASFIYTHFICRYILLWFAFCYVVRILKKIAFDTNSASHPCWSQKVEDTLTTTTTKGRRIWSSNEFNMNKEMCACCNNMINFKLHQRYIKHASKLTTWLNTFQKYKIECI